MKDVAVNHLCWVGGIMIGRQMEKTVELKSDSNSMENIFCWIFVSSATPTLPQYQIFLYTLVSISCTWLSYSPIGFEWLVLIDRNAMWAAIALFDDVFIEFIKSVWETFPSHVHSTDIIIIIIHSTMTRLHDRSSWRTRGRSAKRHNNEIQTILPPKMLNVCSLWKWLKWH